MNNVGGLICGMIAGAIGAAVWAAIAYFGNLEIGWIAWGIGALVGLAVSFGSRERGLLPAMIAVIITFASLCAGKYATVALLVNDQMNIEFTEEFYVSSFAFGIAYTQQEQGETVTLAGGKSIDEAEFADLPQEIRNQAQAQWDSMTADEREQLFDEVEKNNRGIANQFKNQAAFNGFLNSFSLYDLLFFGLGLFTAGRLAWADVVDEDSTPGRDSDEDEIIEP